MYDRDVTIVNETEGVDAIGAVKSTTSGPGIPELADVQFPAAGIIKETGRRRDRTDVKVYFDHPVPVRVGTRIYYTNPATGQSWIILVDGFREMGGRGERFVATGIATPPLPT